MRHILYLLLVANLAYLGWNLYQSNAAAPGEVAEAPLPAGVKRLVTLQESRQQSSDTTDAAPSTTVAVSTTEPAAETGVAGDTTAELDKLTRAEPPGAGSRPDLCQALGPFDAKEALATAAQQLDALGLSARERRAEVREENGYWVYLPSMSREASREITGKLEAAGDKDYFVGKDNYIALGTYQDISRAELRLRQVRKLGLDAILEVRYRTRDAWWLEFEDRDGAAGKLSGLLASQPALQLHALACL
jgi:hypothetical protein